MTSRRRPRPSRRATRAPGRDRSRAGRDARASRPASGRRRRVLRLAVPGAVAVALLAVVGWLGVEALRAQQALDDATGSARQLQHQLSAGDATLARGAMLDLQHSTEVARTSTDGPLWALAARLPVVGSSVDAVRTASDALDDVAQRALPPIVETSTSIDADLFRPSEGAFPLERFATLAEPVSTAAAVLAVNRERIDAIDEDDLVGPLAGPVAELKAEVGSAEQAASAAARALRVAPRMLGADGERTYLLLFQNNAESRATGGIPGALALAHARGGAITVEEQFTTDDLVDLDDPVLELTEDELRTYGTTLGTDVRDVTLTPDFPRTARLAQAMVERSFDVEVDGVLSVDPVALSYALEGTGPIAVGDDTTLTAVNAVDTLLSAVYARYEDPSAQDAFFASAAQRVLTAVLGGRGDSRATLEGLARAADERRLLLWSADEEVESELAATSLAGALPEVGDEPQVGVYVSDSTSSKMQFYLRWDSRVEAVRCSADGRQELRVVTTLTSVAPADVAGLPAYITGNGHRAPTGSQQVNVRVFGPHGGEARSLGVDGERRVFAQGRSGERPVVMTGATVAPGEQVRLVSTFTTGPGQRGETVVVTTPGVVPVEQGTRFPSAC